MKKLLILLSICAVTSVHAADTEWWAQDTICRSITSKCYTVMGAGYDSGKWDANYNCWGLKYICGNAAGNAEKRLVEMAKISDMKEIYTDFDFSMLNATDRCFGVRRTQNNETQAMLKGEYVNVYCKGVLDTDVEATTNGEISLADSQPTCRELANNGWLKVLNNGKCYGKRYPLPDYFIECDEAQTANTRVIVLNGNTNYLINADGASSGTYPTTGKKATAIFNNLVTAAEANHYVKFVEEKTLSKD